MLATGVSWQCGRPDTDGPNHSNHLTPSTPQHLSPEAQHSLSLSLSLCLKQAEKWKDRHVPYEGMYGVIVGCADGRGHGQTSNDCISSRRTSIQLTGVSLSHPPPAINAHATMTAHTQVQQRVVAWTSSGAGQKVSNVANTSTKQCISASVRLVLMRCAVDERGRLEGCPLMFLSVGGDTGGAARAEEHRWKILMDITLG